MDVITYPCWDLGQSMLVNGALDEIYIAEDDFLACKLY